MGILTQHITTEPEPVAQRAAAAGRALPPGLAEVITRCMQKDPNRRYPTMDALVAALVDVYRNVAGAGMSSYMEAFVAPRTGQHTPQTGPRTGNPYGVPPSSASLPTVVPHGPGGTGGFPGGPGQSAGYPPPPPGSGPVMGVSSGTPGSGLYAANASGLVEVAPKKSKAGLIFALIALLAAAGGIVAFVVLGNKKKGAGDGDGTGSQGSAAVHDGTGSNGSAVTPSETPDAAPQVAVADAHPVEGPADAQVAMAPPDAAGPVAVQKVPVLVYAANVTKFDVFQAGKKIGSKPMVIEVDPSSPVVITLKAKNYKDSQVTLDGSTTKVEVKMEKDKPDNNGGNAPPLDCSHALKQPKNADCKRQYCRAHPDDTDCLE
jgi:hypothetical protein